MLPKLNVILLLILLSSIRSQSDGTIAQFQSSRGLGKTPQVDLALQKIMPQIVPIPLITYLLEDIKYTLTTNSIQYIYWSDWQNQQIISTYDEVVIYGGRIQFDFSFQFEIQDINSNKKSNGVGTASVLTDKMTYIKGLSINNTGYLQWQLTPGKTRNISIDNSKIKISQIIPYDVKTNAIILEILNSDKLGIYPRSLRMYMVDSLNQIFPNALNQTLNQASNSQKIKYSYNSVAHGPINLQFNNHLYGFGLDVVNGFRFITLPEIYDDLWQIKCNYTVTNNPFIGEIYGFTQSVYANCFFDEVLTFLGKKGYLNYQLNTTLCHSVTNFEAKDIFDIMSTNFQLDFSGKQNLLAKCEVQSQNINFQTIQSKYYHVTIPNKCQLRCNNLRNETINLLNINLDMDYTIKFGASIQELTFTVHEIQTANIDISEIDGRYKVRNPHQAQEYVNKLAQLMKNKTTFGTGFPTLYRIFDRKIKITKDYTLIYEPPHIDELIQ